MSYPLPERGRLGEASGGVAPKTVSDAARLRDAFVENNRRISIIVQRLEQLRGELYGARSTDTERKVTGPNTAIYSSPSSVTEALSEQHGLLNDLETVVTELTN